MIGEVEFVVLGKIVLVMRAFIVAFLLIGMRRKSSGIIMLIRGCVRVSVRLLWRATIRFSLS